MTRLRPVRPVGGLAAMLLLASPALAGPPFITDDPEPVEPGHWEVYGFSSGAFGHRDASGVIDPGARG